MAVARKILAVSLHWHVKQLLKLSSSMAGRMPRPAIEAFVSDYAKVCQQRFPQPCMPALPLMWGTALVLAPEARYLEVTSSI